MEYIALGKTGLKIGRLGFGGIPIQRVDAAVTKELVKDMAEKGINYIDTARGYTVSENYLGEALEGMRDRFVLATKSMARDKESMAKDIDISLHNLKTNYIDLYQILQYGLPKEPHSRPRYQIQAALAVYYTTKASSRRQV